MIALIPETETVMRRRLNVLIVEDCEATATVLKHMLATDPNITADSVGSLQAALARIARGKPDAVILDINLPDAKDIEGLSKIRLASPHIPVVILTGGGSELEEAAMLTGADDFLEKPPDKESLIRRLRLAVLRRKVYEEMYRKFAPAHESLDATEDVLKEARVIQSIIQEIPKRAGDSKHD